MANQYEGENLLSIIKVRDTGRKVGQKNLTVWDVIVDEPFDGNIQTLSDKAADALKLLIGKGPQRLVLAFDRDFNGVPQYKLMECPGYAYGGQGGGGGQGNNWTPERQAAIERGNSLNAAGAAAAPGEPAMDTLARAEVFLRWLREPTERPAKPVGEKPEPAPQVNATPAKPPTELTWSDFIARFKDALGEYQQVVNFDMTNTEYQKLLLQPLAVELGITYPIKKETSTDTDITLLAAKLGPAAAALLPKQETVESLG